MPVVGHEKSNFDSAILKQYSNYFCLVIRGTDEFGSRNWKEKNSVQKLVR